MRLAFIELGEARRQNPVSGPLPPLPASTVESSALSLSTPSCMKSTHTRCLRSKLPYGAQLYMLHSADVSLQRLMAANAELGELLRARLLWRPAHAPLSWNWLGELGARVTDGAILQRWAAAFGRLGAAMAAAPYTQLSGVALVLALLLLRRRRDRVNADGAVAAVHA